MGLRRSLSSRRLLRRGLASLVVIAAAVGALAHAQVAAAAACSAGTVTTMHSPDGTTRPFYGDWSHGATKHSGYVGYELSGSLGSDLWVISRDSPAVRSDSPRTSPRRSRCARRRRRASRSSTHT